MHTSSASELGLQASVFSPHQDPIVLRPWDSLVSQLLIYQLRHDDMPGFHSRVQFLPTGTMKKSSQELIRGCQEKVIRANVGLYPAPLPSERATSGWTRCSPHHRTFPKCTPEQDGGSAQLSLPCSNGFLPTRLPYVQDHSTARCMSKFSFLKCNFPQNLLASYNVASWLQKRLFCHQGPKQKPHATLTVIMTKERERTSIYKAPEGEFFFVLLL